MDIKLQKDQLDIINRNNKLYSNLYGSMNLAKFIVGNNDFIFSLIGDVGAVNTKISAETSGDSYIVFSMPYNKWQTITLKFSTYNCVNIHITSKTLRVYTDESSDEAVFSINRYNEFDDVDSIANEYTVRQIVNNVKSFNELYMTDELSSDLDLLHNMFSLQSNGNTIGLGRDSLMYADGSLIVKTKLTEPIQESFFKDTDEDYVYISDDIIKLISLLDSRSKVFKFTCNYDAIYWNDENTELYYQGSVQKSELPSDEDFENFKPSTDLSIVSIPANVLKESINFFNGVYENNDWKTLKFNLSKLNGLNLIYTDRDSTVHYTKHVDGIICGLDSEFNLASDVVKNITDKTLKRFGPTENISITYNNSPDTISVLINVSDLYEAILVKLED